MVLTIARFAERTGLSTSALRFYDRKGLLAPRRLENGYRVYSESQIPQARLVGSLREAGVGLSSIRAFLAARSSGRSLMLARWRREATQRLAALALTGRYLDRLGSEEPQIHLARWSEPSTLLWFPAEGAPGPLPFVAAVAERAGELRRRGLRVQDGGYVRTLDFAGGRVVGEVGFRVKRSDPLRTPLGARRDDVPATLFAMLECATEDQRAAHRVFASLASLGFSSAGRSLERYLPGVRDRYELLIAVFEEEE